MALSAIPAVISDMDGVLWRQDDPLPGFHDFFAGLQRHHIPFVLATNNSSKSVDDYLHKFKNMGVTLQPENLMTSALATAHYLKTRYPVGTQVHVLGGNGLRVAIQDAGFTLSETEAAVVAVGLDWNLTYAKLQQAAYLIQRGADFVASNTDATFPTPEGNAPGAGSLVAALMTATQREPVIIGKPHPAMFEAALRQLGAQPQDTLMIGDRLDTDILGAAQLGIQTAMVLTGISSEADVTNSPVKPDYVFPSLADIGAALFAR